MNLTVERSQERNHQEYKLSLAKAVFLHLFPGAIIMTVFMIVAYLARGSELPPVFWFTIAVPFTLVPTELGVLLYLGHKRNGRFSLEGIVVNRQPLQWQQYLWMIPLTFVSVIVLATLTGSADPTIYKQLFGWWPAWLNISVVDENWTKPVVIITYLLFSGIVGPWVEELYFRGYLLPRLSRFGHWGVLLNATLFALYHFWSPWHLISRIFSTLPFALAAQYGSLNVAIITHILVNTVGLILTILPLVI